MSQSSHESMEALETRTLLSASVLGGWQAWTNLVAQVGAVHHVKHHNKGGHGGGGGGGGGGITNTTITGFTPTQVRHAYGIDNIFFGDGSITGDGRGQTIAIVDAYDDPKIASDLSLFNSTFGLPQMDGQNGRPTFTKIKTAKRISSNAGWSLEIALDVEWAHAIAPLANIVLVEAGSNSLSSLLSAVDTARRYAGVSVVSMSWGGSEFSSESSYDSYFTTPSGHNNVTFVASSGDSGAVTEWPAVSPNVLAVGGTSLRLDSSGNYLGESVWSSAGGGTSTYESKPTYESLISLGGTHRTSPDVAYLADPSTGVAVYDTVSYYGQTGWFKVGGTSAGAPQWAGLVAIADQGRASAGQSSLNGRTQLLPALYTAPSSDFHDITSGSISSGSVSYAATTGYDLASGWGSPQSSNVVQDLLAA